MRRFVLAVITVAAMAACNLTGTRQRQQRPGLLRLAPEDSINFVAPDTVLLNQSFEISVSTYGGSCDSKGPTDVLPLSDGSIDFRPFDVTEVNDDQVCTLEVQTFTHTASLTRTVSGPLTITLRGRDWNNSITSRAKSVFVK